MKALILAAGYATRLYPLTKEYPKPLLVVGKKPIIEYIIDKLEASSDIDEIVVVTNSKFFPQFSRWLEGLRIRNRVSLVDDLTKDLSDRRGAIGDMSFAIEQKRIDDDLLVLGGDNLFEEGVANFLSFAKKTQAGAVIGVYDIKDMAQAGKYGVIKLDGKNRVIDFQEKPDKPQSTLVAMCLYYFPKEKLGLIKEYLASKTDKHDATGFYINWLIKKEAVYGFTFSGKWYDIGDTQFYQQAKDEF